MFLSFLCEGQAIDARLELSADSGNVQAARISNEDLLGLQASLLHLVTRCHPTHVEYVRDVFARADALLSRLALNRCACIRTFSIASTRSYSYRTVDCM